MKFIRITCSGCLNSFRQPDFHTYHKSLPLPPKTTVAGMIGGALGISPEKVNDEWLLNNRFCMGVVGKNNGKASDLWQIRKYEKKQIKAFEKGEELTPYKTAVIVRELLYDSEFVLYLHFKNDEDFDSIVEKIQNPEWALSLGREDELILVREIKQVELDEHPNLSFFNTIIPFDLSTTSFDIDVTAQNLSKNLLNEAPSVLKLPVTFTYNENNRAREASEFQTFTFVQNMPVKPKDYKGFFDDELNHSFMIF